MTYKVFLLLIFFLPSASATGLLMNNLGDPDALVLGNQIVFSGTYKEESLDFHIVSKSDFVAAANSGATPTILSSLVDSYSPRDIVSSRYPGHLHRYCNIWAPDLHNDGVNITLTFSAIFKPNTSESCSTIRSQGYEHAIFIATWEPQHGSFSPPLWFSSPNNYVIGTNEPPNPANFNSRVPRIDSERFTENGVTYASYTWFTGAGNANSTVNLSNNSIINNTYPNATYDENITEAPNIFKRNGTYYLVYSENNTNSKYQMYYKKASSIEGLNTSASSCRLTFNSWETRPNSSSTGFNAGHGSVIQVDADYYLIYHMGHGSFYRDTYVSKLEFVGSKIKQIPAPPFVGGGTHVGNLPGCIS